MLPRALYDQHRKPDGSKMPTRCAETTASIGFPAGSGDEKWKAAARRLPATAGAGVDTRESMPARWGVTVDIGRAAVRKAVVMPRRRASVISEMSRARRCYRHAFGAPDGQTS